MSSRSSAERKLNARHAAEIDLTPDVVAMIEAGEVDAARMLLRYAGEDIFVDGGVRTPAMMGWLGSALQRIAAGQDANVALGLVRRQRGRPQRHLSTRDFTIIRACLKGWKPAAVAARFNVSESKVRRLLRTELNRQ
jgi:DNA-binding NarL/FixJ family response regulator